MSGKSKKVEAAGRVFFPLPDLSRKIERDCLQGIFQVIGLFHSHTNPYIFVGHAHTELGAPVATATTVTTAKNLGTWSDNHLTLPENTNKTCRTAYLHIYNIRHIRKYLNKDVTEKLVHAFLIGRIDYSNSILYRLPKVHVNKLQRI